MSKLRDRKDLITRHSPAIEAAAQDLLQLKAQPLPLQCYQVGTCDWFAATSPEHAQELMCVIFGELADGIDEFGAELVSEAMLDKRWVVAGEPSEGGSLREWLAAAKEPGWLGGTEP